MALTGIRTATSGYLEDTLRITHPPRGAVGRGLPRPRRNGAARTACRQLGRRWCRCQCQPLPCETLGNEVACAGNGAVEGGGDVEGWQIRLFCSLYTPEIQASTSTAVGAPLEMQGAHLLCASPSWPTIPLLPGGHAVTDQRGSHSLGVFAATVGYFSEASATAAGRASTRACCRWHCWHWAPSPPRLMAQTPSDPTAATAVLLIVACGRGATRPQARRGGSPTFFSAQAAGGCACQPGALLVAAAGYRWGAVADRTVAPRWPPPLLLRPRGTPRAVRRAGRPRAAQSSTSAGAPHAAQMGAHATRVHIRTRLAPVCPPAEVRPLCPPLGRAVPPPKYQTLD